MPVINVQMLAGRSPEQKNTFMKEVAEVTQRTLGVPEHAVTIILTEVEREHWSVCSRTMAEVQAAAKS